MNRWVEWTTAGCVLCTCAVLAPVGLASGEAVNLAANALGFPGPFLEAQPLSDILARLAVLLPIGEVGIRPHVLAAVACGVALALLVARLRREGPSHMAVAVSASVALVAFSRPFLEVATVHPARAVDFGLVVAIAAMLESIRRDPSRSSVGLGLSLACGLAAGAGWPVRAGTWPLALWLTLRALHRGERWPLLAPILFVAGAGVVLGGVVAAAHSPTATAGLMLHHILTPERWAPGVLGLTNVRAALTSASDDAGVLGLLMSAVGGLVLLVRMRGETIFSLVLWASIWVVSLTSGDPIFARLILVVALTEPIAVAIASLAKTFGRARNAVAVVMAVLVALPAAIGGVGEAMTRPARRNPTAVTHRLDRAAGVAARSIASLTGGEAGRWGRYGQATGLLSGRGDPSGPSADP
jgi:hypothetical protein